MAAIYSGFLTGDGYLFITNDIADKSQNGCAILEINRHCGALLVTTRKEFLDRALLIFETIQFENKREDISSLSEKTAETIMSTFTETFDSDPTYAENPLPFLLLLVGDDFDKTGSYSHIFIRNRVVDRNNSNGVTRYVTEFDYQEPVPARNLFYGYSEIFQYLVQAVSDGSAPLETMKPFACFALAESRKVIGSLYPGVRMASLTAGAGFTRIGVEEIDLCAKSAAAIEARMTADIFAGFREIGG